MYQKLRTTAQRLSKKALSAAMAIFIAGVIYAQDKKVAVFDPAGDVDNRTKEIIREEISSIIVNTNGYSVLERQLIDKVLEENRFQAGGMVDDSQISEMGRMMGANYVFVTNITTLEGGTYFLSLKMVDVQTARVEKQKTTRTTISGISQLYAVVPPTVNEMFGGKAVKQSKQPKISSYYDKGNYLAWSILNTGFPLMVGTSFAGRHGEIQGIGYYLNLGADLAGVGDEVAQFHYQLGVKLFPYKNFFVATGYGTIGTEKVSMSNNSDGNWTTDGWKQSEGILFMGGIDILGNKQPGGGMFFFSVSAGLANDLSSDDLKPVVNIKLGVAWGL